jgi:hypothetical protein
MNAQTLLYRQVNPNWVQGDRVTSQAFKPMPKDEGLLSAYDGDLITPGAAWSHFTEESGFASVGVQAVSVAECDEQNLPSRPDPEPFPEHAVIDFRGLTGGAIERAAKVLRNRAAARGWLLRQPS